MKTDLDSLMLSQGLEGLLVVGSGLHNPPMVYLSGGGHFDQAALVKKRGLPPRLFCRPMERDEAARSGLEVIPFDMQQNITDLRETEGDMAAVEARSLARALAACGLSSGRIAVYGQSDAGFAYAVLNRLAAMLPGLELVGGKGDALLNASMATKDADEIARIRRIGRITTDVVAQTADFLTGHALRGETLIQPNGSPLTIGDVRRRINLWLAERGAENPEATIFAMGRDAGVPHSTGDDTQPLQLGRTIVFDIFPCESGGGYFYDMTRTWCLGYAPDPALKLYEDVRTVFEQLRSELRLGVSARDMQLRCCELFAARGHPTTCRDPNTNDGYVHGLGHGVGLYIHEEPIMRASAADSRRIEANMVVTLEPGLYYPERGLGVRIEDTLWARPDGVFEPLAEFPLDLILPMRG